MEIKPQAVAIPRSTEHLERGKYGPIFPKTPACYGFTIVANVKPGRIMFELSGVAEPVAREAMRRAIHKLPMKCRFITREGEV